MNSNTQFKGWMKSPLALAISGVTALWLASAVQAQTDDEQSADKKETVEQVEEVVVTGSLIPRSNATEMAPMTIIDEEAMKKRGLNTVADLMDSLTENSGFSEGAQSNLMSGFTLGASSVNMRNMGTGRTLVLLNGRRLADYPMPFGGESNGVDVGSIPASIFASVEYLSSGASAIYGSDAMGGVVNIITKRDLEQTLLNVSAGSYVEGYGQDGSISLLTGTAFDRGSVSFALEAFNSSSVDTADIQWIQDNNNGSGFSTGVFDAFKEFKSSNGDCDTVGLGERDEDGYCTTHFDRNTTFMPDNKRVSAYTEGRYDITDTLTAFGSLVYVANEVESKSGLLGWNGVIYDEDGNYVGSANRVFSEAESDGGRQSEIDQNWWSATVGLEADFTLADKAWYWSAAYSESRYNTKEQYGAVKEEIARDWALAGLSYTNLGGGKYQINGADSSTLQAISDNLWTSPSHDTFGNQVTDATSTARTANLLVRGEMFDADWLYEPVQSAFILEYAQQETDIQPDERSKNLDGNGWVNSGFFESQGSRDRYAAGAEFSIPVTEKLELSLAGRYDHYDDDSAISGKMSYQARGKYKLTDTLLVRGGWAQTFRAPDMYNIYGVTKGFTVVPDIVGAGCTDLENCRVNYVSALQTRESDQTLREETGDDFSLGFVFQPTRELNASFDWYNIKVKDMVDTGNAYDLMVDEWRCSTGDFDPDSAFCADINSRVVRNVNGDIESIVVKPLNQASYEISGLDLRGSWMLETATMGSFNLGLSHSATLKHELQTYAGDEVENIKGGELGFSVPTNRTSISVDWRYKLHGFQSVGANLFISRMGEVDNYAQTAKLAPYYNANLTASYNFSAKGYVSMSLNNLFNAMPHADSTNPFYYGYWTHLQNPLGRSIRLNFGYAFN